jgi:hypothetical protein
MRSALLGLALFLVAAGVACGGQRDADAKKATEDVPPGLAQALVGHQTGDLIPTNDTSFQLQLSRWPARFVVRMNAPREAVAPRVSAYFRNLGVDDLASVQLMWCESLMRGDQHVWSCNR